MLLLLNEQITRYKKTNLNDITTKIMKIFSSTALLLVLAFFVISACSSNNNQEKATALSDSDNSQPFDTQGEISGAFQELANKVLENYHDLKAALVETDPEKAKSTAKSLAELTKAIDAETASENYVQLISTIHKNTIPIAETDDIATQRQGFVSLTENVYALAKTLPTSNVVYYAYCPMAFNNEGGYWLEKENTILNPYFGSKMLKCGAIKETIASN